MDLIQSSNAVIRGAKWCRNVDFTLLRPYLYTEARNCLYLQPDTYKFMPELLCMVAKAAAINKMIGLQKADRISNREPFNDQTGESIN